LSIAAVSLHADCLGALYWPEQGQLIVADLHLEKGSSFARRGQLLPPYDTTETLARLAQLIAHYAPRVVVALGDNFHDGGGPARLSASDRASLIALQRGRDWLWIAGNHDPRSGRGHRRHLHRNAGHRPTHLPPQALTRCARWRESPATCIRLRASRSAAAR
jgi:metallophosphoesterase superfamily enzyme